VDLGVATFYANASGAIFNHRLRLLKASLAGFTRMKSIQTVALPRVRKSRKFG
jgi:hypothetical protein